MTTTSTSTPFPLSSEFGDLGSSSPSVVADDYFFGADSHHVQHALPDSELPRILDLFSFGDEELLHDTFYFVGKNSIGRTVWVRRRRILSPKSEPTWLITESWESKFQTLLRLKEYLPDEIQPLLKDRGIPFSKDTTLKDQYEMYLKFRFYRRRADSEEYGSIHLDETLLGITLSFHVSNKLQFDNVASLANKLNLSITSSKLRTLKKGGPVSAHLFGLRQDVLERDDSESDDDDWIEEWNSLVNAQSGTPPLGDPQFTDSAPATTKARQLFNEICFI